MHRVSVQIGTSTGWQVSYKATESREKPLNSFSQSHMVYITSYHATDY